MNNIIILFSGVFIKNLEFLVVLQFENYDNLMVLVYLYNIYKIINISGILWRRFVLNVGLLGEKIFVKVIRIFVDGQYVEFIFREAGKIGLNFFVM